MKKFSCFLLLLVAIRGQSQELYVYTEPASNMPAKSVSAMVTANYVPPQLPYDRFMQRYLVESMAGINKNLMIRAGAGFANMHTDRFRWESAYVYGKYRFLSLDESHRHFRMAAFAEAAYTRSDFHFDEVGLTGDKSGLQAGVIATQLLHRFAISATVSHTQVLHGSRNDKSVVYIPSRVFEVMGYSLSGGYLLLPVNYTDYKQTNVNLYAEVLAQQGMDRSVYYIDFAPAVQLIFNSNTKLNLGYRFELQGNMERMAHSSFMVSIERTFLNALKKKR
ncbi:MAG: hypothetical protein EOO05_17000 [Chitinophagaceae bacterium]|nr:MAG: hypothetical protein EOO05_17000 [Chitinophagaceae bacterium]